MPGRAIFISYRRADAEGEAGRLFDDLIRAYGDSSVFMDVSGIEPGADFRKAIDSNVSGCGVLLAVIGPTWATLTGSDGSRRLDNENDYVRLEIATALGRGIPVIPVLVHEAHMPALDLLPDNLKDLRYRNSVELTHTRWNSDVALLINALKNYVSAEPSHPTETVHATVPVQLPAPQAPASAPNNPPKSKMPLYAMGGLGLAIAVALGIFAVTRHGGDAPSPTVSQPASQSAVQAPPQTTPTPAPTQPDSGQSQPKQADTSPVALVGTWKRAVDSTGGDELEQIAFRNSGGRLVVQAWGECPNGLCDWGQKKATPEGAGAITDSFQPRNIPSEIKQSRSVKLSIQPSGNRLDVTVENTYHPQSGNTVQTGNLLHFVKVP